jgi:hypothetical protein
MEWMILKAERCDWRRRVSRIRYVIRRQGWAGSAIGTKENQAQVGGVGGRIELLGKCTLISAIWLRLEGC